MVKMTFSTSKNQKRHFIENLIEQSLFETINETGVSQLKKKFSLREIAVLDLCAVKSEDMGEMEKAGKRCDAYVEFYEEGHRNRARKIDMTPESEILSSSYKILLKNSFSKEATKNAKSKEDYQKLCLLDLLMEELDVERRKRIERRNGISESVDSAIRLYKGQVACANLEESNKNLEDILITLKQNDYEINLNKLAKLKELLGSQLKVNGLYENERNNLTAKREKMKREINEVINNKVSDRYKEVFPKAEEKYAEMVKKDFPDNEDAGLLGEMHKKTKTLYGMLSFIGDKRAATTKETYQKMETTLSQFDEFNKYKMSVDSRFEKLYNTVVGTIDEIMDGVKNGKCEASIKKLDDFCEIIKDGENTLGKNHIDNEYIFNYQNTKKGEMEKYADLISSKKKECADIIDSSVKYHQDRIKEKSGSFFWRLFHLKRLQNEIKKLNDYRKALLD